MEIVDRSNTEHYLWGTNCDGWHLLKRADLSIITERVSPGESEQRHFHVHSRQFFYILTGEAIIEVDGEKQILQAHQGIEIPPGVVHQFRNESNSDVTFLVISMPKSHGDRVSVLSYFLPT
jgi:mannose-6-phosphate isomerase-like protein (cupin superfamily)